MQALNKVEIVVVTGLSGSGKSTALRVFEDMGFSTIDGLPTCFLSSVAESFARGPNAHRGLALGVDIRQLDFRCSWREGVESLEAGGLRPKIIFVEADTVSIMRRYASTRRPHPLEGDARGLESAIIAERGSLSGLRDRADLVLDTSAFSIHDLRRTVQEKWNYFENDLGTTMRVHILSFGFKYGPPSETDLIFDLRFLPNPYFVEELRPLTGRDESIVDYVLTSQAGRDFVPRLTEFLSYLVPLYAKEGRYRLTIGFGCTGGRHRSVVVAETVYKALQAQGFTLSLEHRHIEKG